MERDEHEAKKRRLYAKFDKMRAEQMSQHWLYLANLASERGDTDQEQRHLDRAQRWLDRLNEIDGLAE